MDLSPQIMREKLLRRAEASIILRKRQARRDFWAFCLYMDPKFFGEQRNFLLTVAQAFMRIFIAYKSGIIRRLAVSMPPRAGKSYISSLFVAWMLGRFPEESVMRNACASDLYNKFSYDTRNIVKSKRYKEIFPEILLSPDKQNVKGWNLITSKQVGYFGGGVGGTIIGFGASMLAMTDDLYKSLEDALSDTNNEKVWSWKQGTHDSRIEGNCCSIDIGTRWSENDVLGRLEEQNKYDEIIRVPALDKKDETFCRAVHTTEYYLEVRNDIDESIWEAEYMQNPIEAKGLLFPKTKLMRFNIEHLKGEPDGIIGACDVADRGDDDLCAPIGAVYGDKIYITNVIFTKDSIEVTEPAVAQSLLDTQCDRMRVESNNGGRIFGQNIKRIVKSEKGNCEIQTKPTTQNKETRILMKSGWIKSHCYFLEESCYKKGSDYDRFMKALMRYKKEGGNKHDDAPDGLTILAEFIVSLGINNLKKKRRQVARATIVH